MADDNGRRRPSPPSRPDPRGGPGAMLSALAVAGLLFGGAIALHYGKLPVFLTPATALGEEATVEGQLTNGSTVTDVTLVVSVPEKAKISEPKDKAEDQHVATVAVRVQNTSEQPIGVAGPGQSLRTDLAKSYDSLTEKTVEVAAGKTRTVKLQFLIPSNEDPDTLSLKVAEQTTKLDVR
ncbi:DUF4352 domain-containing protein [Kineosporia babensis]|uniref:DUF4352 domain-containing protein n=1 Tax=Kineosporia babensis TaxID=499548 RepID=A0A9X1STD5_9ACTN|nr:DUF4352 domain-containing protein [Kineosporia babensis]MCD5311682.1 DUF4352 domain-containing protein [Kineosporia babensis]